MLKQRRLLILPSLALCMMLIAAALGYQTTLPAPVGQVGTVSQVEQQKPLDADAQAIRARQEALKRQQRLYTQFSYGIGALLFVGIPLLGLYVASMVRRSPSAGTDVAMYGLICLASVTAAIFSGIFLGSVAWIAAYALFIVALCAAIAGSIKLVAALPARNRD
ncbi:hypothetical protein L2Y96_19190 [Luteibacter aegosomaticola]|uniref:hypothetical protein n=1 Tax=Luteibacter aegosomaticola TaxID=2911538 RepID=UPI001FF7B169|nr:hypothetical protein [Luteibacter aegosomaticola]UPG89498.1 hypothetical protein L2Y96_19190 [Luteibacter aegosomaticola]